MTMRLDLRTRPQQGYPPEILIRRDCYGCADCGQWFTDPHALVTHDCRMPCICTCPDDCEQEH